MRQNATRRRLFGAEVVDGGVHVRVPCEAPGASVVWDGRSVPLTGADVPGVMEAFLPGAGAGTRYGFTLPGAATPVPDLASRFQPDGVHGLSQVVDPSRFRWSDDGFPGLVPAGQVLYELHVGTFTPRGTFAGVLDRLPALKALGITAIELMPIADWDGEVGWGYDGVALYAPARCYGTPDDLRRLVDGAHALGLGVILDVVYNHLGPSGAYHRLFTPRFFTTRHENEWGEAIDFESSAAVRSFYVDNAVAWIDEYHFDGLRLDATQSIHDASSPHILLELQRAVRGAAGKPVLIVAENEVQEARLVRPETQGGYGLDALWNDDLHHAMRVALTGQREAYYTDTRGTPQELISAARWGTLFQGQYYSWQKQRRGTPALDVKPTGFVTFLENHDQVANSDHGQRLVELAQPAALRALTAFWLLIPGTPMFFQGQEYGAPTPFLYFADHRGELAEAVRKGRLEFLRQFPSLATAEAQAAVPAPGDRATFEACVLCAPVMPRAGEWLALHTELLALRRTDKAFSAQRSDWLFGAVLGERAFALRFLAGGTEDRLVIVNLGSELDASSAAEPLLAPPLGLTWLPLLSTEAHRFGGAGQPELTPPRLPVRASSTLVLAAGEPR